MQALIWVLITVDALIVAAYARLNHHRRRDPARPARTPRRMIPTLVAAGLLPLPALLSTDAPAAAWALWGATVIAAGVTWAVADTLRATAPPPETPGAGDTS